MGRKPNKAYQRDCFRAWKRGEVAKLARFYRVTESAIRQAARRYMIRVGATLALLAAMPLASAQGGPLDDLMNDEPYRPILSAPYPAPRPVYTSPIYAPPSWSGRTYSTGRDSSVTFWGDERGNSVSCRNYGTLTFCD